MKIKFLMALCITGLSSAYASADDVYIYSGEDSNPTEVKVLTNVKKISFSETAITVTTADGTETPVNFTDFDFFSFDEKEGSVEKVAAGATKVWMADGVLNAESSSPIERVEIYSAQGAKLTDEAPMVAKYSNTLDVAAGIYLVKVTTGGKTEIQKIIKH